MTAISGLDPPDTLRGIRLGVSVSDSADLAMLGLAPRHAELAMGEIARAVLVAGGSLVYGGRVKPSGFTQFLMHEVRRYGRDAASLTLCLAAPEHQRLSRAELDALDRDLGTKGRVVCLDEDGGVIQDPLSLQGSRAESCHGHWTAAGQLQFAAAPPRGDHRCARDPGGPTVRIQGRDAGRDRRNHHGGGG